MSKTIGEISTEAYFLVVQRPDGAGFASTSSDQQMRLDNVTLEPDVDLRPSELVLAEAMLGSRLEIAGQLSSPALSSSDLIDGRWNGASLRLLAGDWQEKVDASLLCEGELGPVRIDAGKLSMAIDILPAAIRKPPCVQTSPECRAVLGDRECRVDMRARRRRVIVADVYDDGVLIDLVDNERFALGRLRWISGSHCGLEQRIIGVDGAKLVLQAADFGDYRVGDRAVLTEGCDGRRVTCTGRFANIQNFRGEPDLPGSEILLHFPGD